MTIKIKKLHQDAVVPKYPKEHDAGMDFYASESLVLQPGERRLVPTGISMAIPQGFVGLIWDKSGIATKHGLKTMAGVIDAGYRGEIRILVHNLSNEEYVVEKGNKVAQMLIQSVEQREVMEVSELDETDRGEGGFGSTGIN
ncbi:dUTP diphosphatase [Candidatus Woesearchaeota archaeon]|jgi:dUTP pyrophosphatase|nr:dUTP diphosphatase [Candidatus Woesearchaeota archaeon]MBT4150542.1 dUTP diphosphatase [Candidatus Woesearchaeota archaeon]MBT4247183.1 dUTP diphosphatase [Candidatus Woesearchaeota archaeon]MBT4434592.1 dUTP diphosphatase [Candidatus Woesearchaeota archaeon]MBT7331965.1 dUTP diphosphatase [Candidatus Woesearchaeota archaeon]